MAPSSSPLPEQTDALPDYAAAIDAGAALVATLYSWPERWSSVTLSPDDMPTQPTRWALRALQELHRRGLEPDVSVFVDALRELGARIQPEGGDISLSQISDLTARASRLNNVEEYERIIRRWGQLRHLRQVHARLGGLLAGGQAEEALALLNTALTAGASRRPTSRTIGEVMRRVAELLENPLPTIPTGIGPLDRLLDGGLRPGEMMCIAARPGQGKSAFAEQVITYAAQCGHPCAVWNFEMSSEQWGRRAISSHSAVGMSALRTGDIGEHDYGRIVNAMGTLHRLPVHLVDSYESTAEAWRMEATWQVRENGAKLLVIDYLQLMDGGQAETRQLEVARLSRTIKRTLLELGVSALVLSQLNRDAEGRRPGLQHLRESGSLEQDSDHVFFLHRDKDEETGKLQRVGIGDLAKQRDGDTGIFPITYDGATYRFAA